MPDLSHANAVSGRPEIPRISEPTWTVERAPLHWLQWGDAWLLFHGASGQTHFLSQTAQDIVSLLLERGDCATTILHRALLARYRIDEDDDLLATLSEVLVQLDGLGVIGQARV